MIFYNLLVLSESAVRPVFIVNAISSVSLLVSTKPAGNRTLRALVIEHQFSDLPSEYKPIHFPCDKLRDLHCFSVLGITSLASIVVCDVNSGTQGLK